MPSVDIHDVGAIGIVRDVADHLLPENAWSDGRNVRFDDDKAEKFGGHGAVFGTPTAAPYWLLPVRSPAEFFWIYAGLAKVYVYDGSSHSDITRSVGGDYSATEDDTWNGGLLGGIPILNSGADVPQYWPTLSAATRLADLTNWPASTTTKILRPFKNFLVGLDWTESGTRSPHKVRWSTDADPGALPSTWDITDATKNAGETELSDTGAGFLVDQLPLRDINIIYKENSTWGMQLIGGQFVFRFFKILEGSGLLSQHCVSVVGQGEAHFLHTGEELILLDGQNVAQVLNKKLTRWLQRTISSTRFERCFTVRNQHRREMWFCFPEEGQDWPNLAIVWNWTHNTASIKELSPAAIMSSGEIFESTVETWNSDSGTWDSDASTWDTFKHKIHEQRLLKADPVNTKLYFEDDASINTHNGGAPTAYLERTGLGIVGRSRSGMAKVDLQSAKTVNRIWIKANGGPFDVRVGGQDRVDGPVTWSAPQSFDPTTQKYLDVFQTHRLLAVRFESSADVFWELEGYDLDLDVSSEL